MKGLKTLLLVVVVGCLFALPSKVFAASLISNIEIEGIGSIGLGRATHDLGLQTSFDYTNITVTPANEGITIEGAGKVPIQEGLNKIVITASDGKATETHTINLNVSKISGTIQSGNSYEKGGEIKNPETGAFLNYTLIIVSLLSAAFVIKTTTKKAKFHRI